MAVAGYTGRKRGEVVRSRVVLQQAHTREWLGTFGDAGNGERRPRLRRAAELVAAYVSTRGLAPGDGVLRLDGEHGNACTVLDLDAHGVGHLMRCVDYKLLDHPTVQGALGEAPVRFVQEDTGTVRELYDVGWISWWSVIDGAEVRTRLVVAATQAPPADVDIKIGKRVGDRVFELFATSLSPEEATAADVITLYFGRGGFEQTLSEEDRELEPDRWYSGHPPGQELGQILAQWVWNTRLWLGRATAPVNGRITLLGEAIAASAPPTPKDAEPSEILEAPPAVEPPAPQAPRAEAPQSPRAAQPPFVLMPDLTLRCPAGKTLRKREERRDRIRFSARQSDCRHCPLAESCLGRGASQDRGRRVDWPRADLAKAPLSPPPPPPSPPPAPPFSPPAPPGPEPLRWHDLPATALRRLLPKLLRQQRVDFHAPAPTSAVPPSPPIHTRAQRAHRRLTWSERLSRNARSASGPHPHLHVYGVPPSLATLLNLERPE